MFQENSWNIHGIINEEEQKIIREGKESARGEDKTLPIMTKMGCRPVSSVDEFVILSYDTIDEPKNLTNN